MDDLKHFADAAGIVQAGVENPECVKLGLVGLLDVQGDLGAELTHHHLALAAVADGGAVEQQFNQRRLLGERQPPLLRLLRGGRCAAPTEGLG